MKIRNHKLFDIFIQLCYHLHGLKSQGTNHNGRRQSFTKETDTLCLHRKPLWEICEKEVIAMHELILVLALIFFITLLIKK